MNGERLFRILGLVDDGLIEEAAPAVPSAARKRRAVPQRVLALAACLMLICGLGLWFRGHGQMNGSSSGGADGMTPGSNGAGGNGHEAGTVFMSYAGPAFPLTTEEDAPALTAERTLTWDFAPGAYDDGEPRQWGAQVTDSYILTNATQEDITVTALYPFAGGFDELAKIAPAVTVDGVEPETALYAGPFSGGLQDMEGRRDPADEDAWNLYYPDSWESYRSLLESGAYQAQALGPGPALDIPVTVYEFSDFTAPHEQYQAATQAISFTMDGSATQILSYGFNGYGWDGETGLRQYSYFVPNGVRRDQECKLLIVLGEDIGPYTLQGYQDGGCDAGEEIDGVSCTVMRRETVLNEVLDQLSREYRHFCRRGLAADQEDPFASVSLSMYQRAVAEFLLEYTNLSDAPKRRYEDGRLDEIFQEALFLQRVLYLRFSVTVPAGDSVTVDCSLWKEPSYDFHCCSGSENVGLQGYDLVTRLGSNLAFTRQTAALENTDGIEIVRQNLDFALESGVTSVELDPTQEHYYLEVKVKE